MRNLTHLNFRFGLKNSLNDLTIRVFDMMTGKTVYASQMAIPPQDYKYWTEIVDGQEVTHREYISGGFHNGKFSRSFRGEICRDIIAGIKSKHPGAIIPSNDSLREQILNTLNIEGLAPGLGSKADEPE